MIGTCCSSAAPFGATNADGGALIGAVGAGRENSPSSMSTPQSEEIELREDKQAISVIPVGGLAEWQTCLLCRPAGSLPPQVRKVVVGSDLIPHLSRYDLL